MVRKTSGPCVGVTVNLVKRRSNLRAPTHRRTKTYSQNNEMSVIHVTLKPSVYEPKTITTRNDSSMQRTKLSLPVATINKSLFAESNATYPKITTTDRLEKKTNSGHTSLHSFQGSTRSVENCASNNESFNLAPDSETSLRDTWSLKSIEQRSPDHNKIRDWKTIAEDKNKNYRKRFSHSARICCCHPWLCCFLTALAALLLATAITAILISTLIPQRTTAPQASSTTLSINTTVTTTVSTTGSTASVSAVTSMEVTSAFISTDSTSTTTTAPPLLINPGAEFGTRSPWTSSSSSSPMLDNGTANSGSTLPHSGSFSFYGGSGGGSLHQTVSLTSLYSTTQIDTGSLYASISYWEKSANAPALDTAQVTLVFMSAANTTLSSATTGPTACILAWCYVTGNWSVPVGARTIDYVMTFVANYGTFADAWIDDNTLAVA